MLQNGGIIHVSDVNNELYRAWNSGFTFNDYYGRCLNGTRDGGAVAMSNWWNKEMTASWLSAGVQPVPPPSPSGQLSFYSGYTGFNNGEFSSAFGGLSEVWHRGYRIFELNTKPGDRLYIGIFGNVPQGAFQYIDIWDSNSNLVYRRAASQLNWYQYIADGYNYTLFGWDSGGFMFTEGQGYTVHLYG